MANAVSFLMANVVVEQVCSQAREKRPTGREKAKRGGGKLS